MSSDENPAIPAYQQQGYELQAQQGYQPPPQQGYQPPPQQGYQAQQFPVNPPYNTNGSVSAAEIQGTEYNRLEEGDGRADQDNSEIEGDIPGRGPGGVPDKYFVVSKI